MEEAYLIQLTPHNYHAWSQLAIRYLSQHNVLPYAPDLEFNFDQRDIILRTLWLHMDQDVMDSTDDIKSSDPYVYWMFLWETYGDPSIPPFPKELIPPVAADTSSDEITPPAPVAPVPATDASDSVQQDTSCLPTLPSCDDFVADIT